MARGAEGDAPSTGCSTRGCAGVEAVVHNQDNREHDLLDSDDYYQFEGGLAAAVRASVGRAAGGLSQRPFAARDARASARLDEEIGRVVRARVVNPKWIAGVMRHGYKGAFEIAATVDYLFAFAATTGAVHDHHFDLALRRLSRATHAVRGFHRRAQSRGAARDGGALRRGACDARPLAAARQQCRA